MNSIFEKLKGLSKKESKDDNDWSDTDQTRDQHSKMKPASYIYLDEHNQVKEIPLSKLDSAGSHYINRTIYKNPAKFIHDSISPLILKFWF